MRDEWIAKDGTPVSNDSRSSQGLTRVGRQTESNKSATSRSGGLDRSASLTLAHKGMRLKSKGLGELKNREVSPRRQVGDVESMQQDSMDEPKDGRAPWWRNVGMEEGL